MTARGIRHARRWAVASGIAAIAIGGCGTGGSNSDVATLLAGVPSALASAHSFRITIAGSGSAPGQGSQSVHGEGLVDWTSDSADLQLTSAGKVQRLVIVGGTGYLQRPATVAASAPRWLSVSLGHQSLLGGLDPIGDPLTTLATLRSQLTNVSNVGSTEVGGVSTTEIKGRLDHWESSHGKAAITAWIDHQGRVRQLHILATGDGQADITEQFSDFGVPVHITAPPASDVASLQSLLKTQLNKQLGKPSAGLRAEFEKLTTCRAFSGSSAAKRLKETSGIFIGMRMTFTRAPAAPQVRTAFAEAVLAACSEAPDKQWPDVATRVFLDNRHAYTR